MIVGGLDRGSNVCCSLKLLSLTIDMAHQSPNRVSTREGGTPQLPLPPMHGAAHKRWASRHPTMNPLAWCYRADGPRPRGGGRIPHQQRTACNNMSPATPLQGAAWPHHRLSYAVRRPTHVLATTQVVLLNPQALTLGQGCGLSCIVTSTVPSTWLRLE
jgi:hypothetical protein